MVMEVTRYCIYISLILYITLYTYLFYNMTTPHELSNLDKFTMYTPTYLVDRYITLTRVYLLINIH